MSEDTLKEANWPGSNLFCSLSQDLTGMHQINYSCDFKNPHVTLTGTATFSGQPLLPFPVGRKCISHQQDRVWEYPLICSRTVNLGNNSFRKGP